MSFRRKHQTILKKEQRFLSAGLVERPMGVLLREGSPVRVSSKFRPWGFPQGRYKGRVTAVGNSIWDDQGFVRIIITKAPAGGCWYVGRPMYVKPSFLKLLPSRIS